LSWKDRLKGDSVSWLLESDEHQPAVRYFALRDILERGEEEAEVKEARAAIMSSGPVPVILANQEPEGYWCQPGPGYGPKYQGTVWQVIFLAQLGADGSDPKVKAGCEYILSNTVAKHGGFAIYGTPSSFIHCMAGNLGAALLDLGWHGEPRLQTALEWQARSITGVGVAPRVSKNKVERYYASNPGPGFACGANDGLPCAWGAVKAMLAMGKIPPTARSQVVQSAIKQGIEFLLSRDPAVADYPFGYGNKPSSSWFKFGYPVGYVTDVLQNLEALAALGQARDERLAGALAMVEEKQDARGWWKLEYTYNGKTWVDIETKGQPSKWVTLRAIRVLKAAYPE